MALHLHSTNNLFRILLLIISLLFIVHAESALPYSSNSIKTTTYKKFVKNECNSTTYPKVCYKSLSPYASKIQTNRLTLAKVATYLSLKSARSASNTLAKLSRSKKLTHAETLVIADCRENIGDTLELLEQSADGLVHLNGTSSNDERFQWDSIKTWMSAALTDESTCTDELEEMEVRSSIQKKIRTCVGSLAWMNSNALALVNRLSF